MDRDRGEQVVYNSYPLNSQQYNTFVILSEPRTGSTVISNKFGLIDGLHCQGEIFHPDEIYTSIKLKSIPSLKDRNEEPVAFLKKVFEQTFIQKEQPVIIGFKLFFDHNQQITDYVVETGMPVILLERTNKLAQFSSLKIAKKTGQWHSKQRLSEAQKKVNEEQGRLVKFSLLELLAFSVRSYLRFSMIKKRLRRNNCLYHYVAYEKIFEPDQWNKLVQFLQIEADEVDFKPSLKKQRKGNLLSTFSNPGYALFCCRVLKLLPFTNFIHLPDEVFESV